MSIEMAFSLLLTILLARSALDAAPIAEHAPLRAYAGTWRVTRTGMPPGAKPDELKNDCAAVGRYFACQQTINGNVGGLLLVIPAAAPGRYYTQNVTPNGRATGAGELQITNPGKDGETWVFSSTWNQGSRTVRYRTTNVFSGKNRIHFKQEESDDGVRWKVTNSGEDVRVPGR